MKKSHVTILCVAAFTVLITIYSEIAIDVALLSLKNTITLIIPSLFPYMIISSMIISSGAANAMGKIIPVSKAFNLPYCASTPIILGALCGFPLGAKSSAELYEKGYLSKIEAEILISVANNTGPSFLVFIIGAVYWKDIRFGFFLYSTQLITAFLSGIIINRIIFKSDTQIKRMEYKTESQDLLEGLSNAVNNASISSIYICGFITFFAILNSILQEVLSESPDFLRLLISAFLEFSEAASSSSKHQGFFSYFICGYAVGWSGLSVFCQTAGFTTRLGLSLKRCFLTKLLQGILLGIACMIYAKLTLKCDKYPCFSSIEAIHHPITLFICFTLIILYVFSYIKKHKGA